MSVSAAADQSRERVARLRAKRKNSGLAEKTIWLDADIRKGLKDAVESGRFRSQVEAIDTVLKNAFANTAEGAEQ